MSLLTIPTLIVLALTLSVDTFAASISKGASFKKLKRSQRHRIAIIFTACAVTAIAIGWSVGSLLSSFITEIDHWIAFALLSATGSHMVYNGWTSEAEKPDRDLSPIHILVTAVATNIDAVAVGIGLAFININVLAVCFTLGITTAAAVYGGIYLGRRSKRLLGARAEIIGGLVLIAIGIKILLQHLLA